MSSCPVLLLVEHVLVLHCEVVAVAAGYRVAKAGSHCRVSCRGSDVHDSHVLWATAPGLQDTHKTRGSEQAIGKAGWGALLKQGNIDLTNSSATAHLEYNLTNIFL